MTAYDWRSGPHGSDVATRATRGETLFAMALRPSRDAARRVDAHMHFNLAAGLGVEGAATHRAEIAKTMSRFEVGRALRAARVWTAAS